MMFFGLEKYNFLQEKIIFFFATNVENEVYASAGRKWNEMKMKIR